MFFPHLDTRLSDVDVYHLSLQKKDKNVIVCLKNIIKTQTKIVKLTIPMLKEFQLAMRPTFEFSRETNDASPANANRARVAGMRGSRSIPQGLSEMERERDSLSVKMNISRCCSVLCPDHSLDL